MSFLPSKPKISVVTPTLNCGKYISSCIESVLAQNYPNFEHIIVDGASTDNTVEILKKYPHVRWISKKDNGEAQALNRGLAMTQGDVINWLNADDYLTSGAFEKVVCEFAKHDETCVVFGDLEYVNESGQVLFDALSPRKVGLPVIIRWWKNVLHPHQPTIFYPKKVLDAIGPFREDLFFAIDQEYQLRTAVQFPFFNVGDVVAHARLREDCKSALAGQECHDIHRAISVSYVKNLNTLEQISFWFDYLIQHHLPLPADVKIKFGIRTKLKRLLGM